MVSNGGRDLPRKKPEKTRINMDMSSTSVERMERLKDITEASSYTEVVKNALKLYEALIAEAQKGNEFLMRSPSGELMSYKIFL